MTIFEKLEQDKNSALTVAELIALLQNLDGDKKIYLEAHEVGEYITAKNIDIYEAKDHIEIGIEEN